MRARFRIRTLMFAAIVAALGLAVLRWYTTINSLESLLMPFVVVPGAIVVAAMVALWINWRAPH